VFERALVDRLEQLPVGVFVDTDQFVRFDPHVHLGVDVDALVVALDVVVDRRVRDNPLELDVVTRLELLFDPLARTVARGVDEGAVRCNRQGSVVFTPRSIWCRPVPVRQSVRQYIRPDRRQSFRRRVL